MTDAAPSRRKRSASKPARNGLASPRVWIDRVYHARFIRRLFLTICAVVVTGSLLAMLLLWSLFYRTGSSNQHVLIASLIGVAVSVLIELLIAVPLVYSLGTRQSRQVVGPLRRITRALGAIGSGDFSQRVTIRQNDVLEPVATSINRMAERLQKRHHNHGR